MTAPRLLSLTEIEAAVWIELARSVRDKQHAWRTPVLATTDGELGDARVVVLREASPDDKRLLVYTDHRSAKAAQLAAHPLGTLVMWSPSLGWQLRCKVRLAPNLDHGRTVMRRERAGLAAVTLQHLVDDLVLTLVAHDTGVGGVEVGDIGLDARQLIQNTRLPHFTRALEHASINALR